MKTEKTMRQKREALGLTQEGVARSLDVPVRTYSAWERAHQGMGYIPKKRERVRWMEFINKQKRSAK